MVVVMERVIVLCICARNLAMVKNRPDPFAIGAILITMTFNNSYIPTSADANH
jgi:hypothetical protein